MKRLYKSGFMKILSAAIIVIASLFFLTCDDKKDNSSSNLLLMLLGGGSSKLVLYNAGTHDGNLKGAEADARTGADAICNSSANKPSGVTKVHAFISISAADQISDMPAHYGYSTGSAIYGTDGTQLIANNWADMLDNSINMSLNSAGVIPAEHFLSATNSNGTYRSIENECNGFTDSIHTNYYYAGWGDTVGGDWLTAMSDYCDVSSAYVLCIGEQ
jgi:hypothetical protein